MSDKTDEERFRRSEILADPLHPEYQHELEKSRLREEIKTLRLVLKTIREWSDSFDPVKCDMGSGLPADLLKILDDVLEARP